MRTLRLSSGTAAAPGNIIVLIFARNQQTYDRNDTNATEGGEPLPWSIKRADVSLDSSTLQGGVHESVQSTLCSDSCTGLSDCERGSVRECLSHDNENPQSVVCRDSLWGPPGGQRIGENLSFQKLI